MTILGYARTSTTDQTAGLDAQVTELTAAGCDRIYREHISGAQDDRPQLEAMIDYAREGDRVLVTKVDRLARSTLHLWSIIERLRAKRVELRIISLGLDTATPMGELMLTFLGGIAAFERAMMLERQRAGIAAAKVRGVYKGRVPTARRQSENVLRLRADGLGGSEIAARLGIGRASVYRILAGEARAAAG